jgi:hypothetical protein
MRIKMLLITLIVVACVNAQLTRHHLLNWAYDTLLIDSISGRKIGAGVFESKYMANPRLTLTYGSGGAYLNLYDSLNNLKCVIRGYGNGTDATQAYFTGGKLAVGSTTADSTLSITGSAHITGNAKIDGNVTINAINITPSAGTFDDTLTGLWSIDQRGTAKYYKSGRLVIITFSLLHATTASDDSTFVLKGIPIAIRPTGTRTIPITISYMSGYTMARMQISTDGTATITKCDNGFFNSGQDCGLDENVQITYMTE